MMGVNFKIREERGAQMDLRASFALIVFAVGCPAAVAATVPDIVRSRQSDMKEIATSTKVMADMFKEPDTYASGSFGTAAEEIIARSGSHLTANFSELAAAPGSKATDAIRDERARFAALAENLKTYATALAAAAHDHPDSMTEDMRMKANEPMEGGLLGIAPRPSQKMSAEHAFHLMLQTCASCHARFRQRD